MPELPEVETITRQLDKALVGEIVSGIVVLRGKSFIGKEEELLGKKVKKVERKAKMIIVRFGLGDKVLVIHLKMTGQLIYVNGKRRVVGGHPTPDWVNALPSKDTRVEIDFEGGGKLYFNDLRVFGWLKLLSGDQFLELYSRLPPDVTDDDFTLEFFKKGLEKTGRPIKIALTDQTRFGGIGNIYANDALYLAKINPKKKARDLNEEETKKLFNSVKKVIGLGIRYGGSSVDKYVNAAGLGGTYQDHFLVYQRDGERCRRDGAVIRKVRLGGRGTFYCPVCQKD